VWRLLRGPFCLPACSRAYHRCEWQVFDMDLAGCLLCGAIHACRDGACPVTETNESECCEITGVCLRPIRLSADAEFMDTTVARHNPKLSHNDSDSAVPAYVRIYVEELLLSSAAREAHRKHVERFQAKMAQSLRVCGGASSIDALVEAYGRTYERTPCMFAFNEDMRRRLAAWCTAQLQCTIMKFQKQMKLNIKMSFIRDTVFGLMYVMRDGISINHCRIMPRVPILSLLLPAESMLERFFGFKAKMITDVENRCKINFRTNGFSDSDRCNFSSIK